MSAVRGKVVRFAIGEFEAEVTIPPIKKGHASIATCEWFPRVPRFDVELTSAQRREYQRQLMSAIRAAEP